MKKSIKYLEVKYSCVALAISVAHLVNIHHLVPQQILPKNATYSPIVSASKIHSVNESAKSFN